MLLIIFIYITYKIMSETEILKPKSSQKRIIYEDGDNNFKLPRI